MKGRGFGGFVAVTLAMATAALPETVAGPAFAEVRETGQERVVWANADVEGESAFASGLFVMVSSWRFERGTGFARSQD